MPLPNLNTSNRSRNPNNSIIEIFDSPSIIPSENCINSLRRRSRVRRFLPYEEIVSPSASSSQSRRSQLESPITCPICLENVRNNIPVSTNCGHIFCKECLRQALQSVKKCPMCKKSLTRSSQYHDIFI